MKKWFVSTARKLREDQRFDVIWTTQRFRDEDEAKRFAAEILLRGQRVEAGTLLDGEYKVCVPWSKARKWANSRDEVRSARSGAVGRRPAGGR
jgi:hypothetical protein